MKTIIVNEKDLMVGDTMKLINDGKGLIKDLTVGEEYKIVKLFKRSEHSEQIKFQIINDKNKRKSYFAKQLCWFEFYRSENVTQKLVDALKECLEWMEDLRESGDAGFWEWHDDSEYAKAKKLINELKGKKVKRNKKDKEQIALENGEW